MATTIQFVDSIASSPTVRLDINASPWQVAFDQFNLSPPPLRRATAATLMTDGAVIPASAYDNRRLQMRLELVHTSQDNAATEMQKLARELNRPTNILKYQPGTTAPVFFRTHRSPDFTWTVVNDATASYFYADLDIVAEPFGYGLLETPTSAVTVDTNPAAGTNPGYVDVTGVKGDVETPAIIQWPAAAITTGRELGVAGRRRGAPSGMLGVFQAESMTLGTNASLPGNDANMSGAGSNYVRVTPGTATWATRISTTDLGTAAADLRGRYRVFCRYRKATGADGWNLRLLWGDAAALITVTNDEFATANTTAISTADLGEIAVPVGQDPVYDPTTGVELSVSDSFFLALQAERTSGTGTIDFDFLQPVPADDRFAVVRFGDDSSTGSDHWILNAADNSAYARDSSSRVFSAAPASITGGLPYLTPNQTNRIFLLRSIGTGTAGGGWALTTATPVSISYLPRYLTVRPAST